jgi:hypothetical protein
MARWMPRFWTQPNFLHPVVGSHSLQALLDVDGPAFQAPLALQAGRGWPQLSSLELRALGPWQDIPPIFMHFSWPRTLRRRMNSQISAKFTEIFWESCSCHILNGISDIAPALHKSPLSPHKPHVITCDIMYCYVMASCDTHFFTNTCGEKRTNIGNGLLKLSSALRQLQPSLSPNRGRGQRPETNIKRPWGAHVLQMCKRNVISSQICRFVSNEWRFPTQLITSSLLYALFLPVPLPIASSHSVVTAVVPQKVILLPFPLKLQFVD